MTGKTMRDGAANVMGTISATDPNPEGKRVAQEEASVVPPEKAPEGMQMPPLRHRDIEAAMAQGLMVVDAEIDGNYLFITIEGDCVEDVQGPEGRKLAYAARHAYGGFTDGGIEPYGGAGPADGKKYRQTFRLTRMMI